MKNLKAKELTSYFQKFADKTDLKEILKIVKANSEGKIWLIGGFLYRGIVYEMYGGELPSPDFDFIVEKRKERLNLPSNWTALNNKYGNPKFRNSKDSVDFVPLDTVLSLKLRKFEPTIENYLSGTPLTIQSIAYDCIRKQVMGEVGAGAILNKTVGSNYIRSAEHEAKLKNITVNDLILKKAGSLKFEPILY